MSRRFVFGMLLIAGAASAIAYAVRGDIALALMERALERNMRGDPIAELPDGLHVGLCGAGAPMPAVDRSGPCVVVMVAHEGLPSGVY